MLEDISLSIPSKSLIFKRTKFLFCRVKKRLPFKNINEVKIEIRVANSVQ